jgi:hypothetical protein
MSARPTTLATNQITTPQAAMTQAKTPRLVKLAEFLGLRVLFWKETELYSSRGYCLLKTKVREDTALDWQAVGTYREGIRSLTASTRLSSRLFRDGFHALVVLPSGDIVAAVPGKILTLAPGTMEFRVTHTLLRGTRPLHITAAPNDRVVWGEYFDNPHRDQVYIYGSTDQGNRWDVAYAFPKGQIRHVHNIVYDEWENLYWILTGDVGQECRIMRATLDFSQIETVFSGTQQHRSAALVTTRDAVYWSSDTPREPNHIYRLDRQGNLATVAGIRGSSIYGCRAGDSLFFSTMVEPSRVNLERNVCVFGSGDGKSWERLLQWKKDSWPMKLFQYGNAFLPDGVNQTNLLAVSTIAVKHADIITSIFRVSPR